MTEETKPKTSKPETPKLSGPSKRAFKSAIDKVRNTPVRGKGGGGWIAGYLAALRALEEELKL